jgi:hypothetical protein
MLNTQVIGLWLNFKVVVRNDFLETSDHILGLHRLCGLLLPKSGGFGALLGVAELSEDFTLILEHFEKITTEQSFVIVIPLSDQIFIVSVQLLFLIA